MTTSQKILGAIFGAQVVLIVFFGAFKFEKITLFLYSGTWIGIGVAMFLFPRTTMLQKVKIIGAVFGVQILVFATLDFFYHLSDLVLEEIGFLSIGAWMGLLMGILVGMIEKLEQRIKTLESDTDSNAMEGHG